jgi:histidyl-tRNA synthetase
MSQQLAGVKGMNDLLPPQSFLWQHIESVARELFSNFGYSEIRTPIVEDTALFVRSVGEITDIVKKEMYTFEDKGNRSITMRPEGTAPAARAYIEHGVAQTDPLTRWFYMGPMFRYERMKTGRYRQFSQIGAEAYGTLDPAFDVEIIAMCFEFFKKLGLPDIVLHLNSLGESSSRGVYVEALKKHFEPFESVMSADAKLTFEKNCMRLLDSKEEALATAISTAPAILDFIDEKSLAHFEDVKRLLSKLNIPFVLDRRLVRGLDYYTRTTFEFVYSPLGESTLGTAGTVCGGGRYDGLVKELGGPEKPAVGFAMGLDRLALLLEAQGAHKRKGPLLFIGSFDGTLRDEAVALTMKLRAAGHSVDFDPRGGKLGKQNERADKVGAKYFAAYGQNEHDSQSLKLKNLTLPRDTPDTDPRKFVEIKLAQLESWLQLEAHE